MKKTLKPNKIYKNKDVEASKKYLDRQNEIITYRLMILFGVAVCVVGFFVYAMNLKWGEMSRLEDISAAGLIATGIPLVFSALFFMYRKTQKTDESDAVIKSAGLLAVASFLFVSDFIIFATRQDWIPFLTAFAIAATLLVFIYYLYQREFFCFSVFAAAGCFLLYFAQSPLLSFWIKNGFKALLAVFAVFTLVFALALSRGKGRLKYKPLGLDVQILEKNSKYFQFFVLSVFIAGFVFASLFLTAYFFYVICALIVCFVVVGIYFTVKMI